MEAAFRVSANGARIARWALPGLAALAITGIPVPACAQTTPPQPQVRSAPAPHVPIDVTLGGLHLSVDVPLDLPALLGGSKTPTSPPSSPVHPTAPPRRRPTAVALRPSSPAPRAAHANPPARPSTIAVIAPQQRVVTAPGPAARASHSAAPPSRPIPAAVPPTHPKAVQKVLRPGSPTLILSTIVLACGLGTIVVVRAAGHRRVTPASAPVENGTREPVQITAPREH